MPTPRKPPEAMEWWLCKCPDRKGRFMGQVLADPVTKGDGIALVFCEPCIRKKYWDIKKFRGNR